MNERSGLRIVLLVLFVVLLSAFGQTGLAQTPTAPAEPTPGATTEAVTQSSTPEVMAEDGTPTDEEPAPTPTKLLEGVILTRTPMPTATPDLLAEGVSKITEETGLAGETFLGLPVEDWFNLALSLVVVLLGYLIGTWLIRRVLPRVVRHTATELDDHLLQSIGPDLRWLVVILILDFATRRLSFASPALKALLSDAYFVLGLAMGMRILWRLIGLADEWYRERLAREERLEQLEPVMTLLVRLGRVVLAVILIAVLLNHFGVDVTAFAAALGLGGLAISLAAKDTIADAIAGFIILVDRPFRIGDRIEIQGVGTWGDVTDIGLRTTRIRTRDNRMVIVPNSVIGSNQVINYSYPDPRYRIQTHVGVAYGTDIETARQVIVEAVRQVEGVLPDKPVDALYIEMGDSAMIFRVRWWIESYIDARRMFDRVHTALQHALDEAGIELPYPTQTLSVQIDGEAAEHRHQILKDAGEA
jgi:MscS family membrane protein